MKNVLKKSLVKVTSVGMSVAMAATPLTAMAAEDNEETPIEGEPAEPTQAPDEAPVVEESKTPVADYVQDVSDSLVERTEPQEPTNLDNGAPIQLPELLDGDIQVQVPAEPAEENQNQVPAEPVEENQNQVPAEPVDENQNQVPAEPVDENQNQVPAEPVDENQNQVPAEPVDENQNQLPMDIDAENQGQEVDDVDEALQDAQVSLDGLAEDVRDVELANDAAETFADEAQDAEGTAATEASEADTAATKALETVSDEDIAAAKTELDEANDALEKAENAKTLADDKLAEAEQKLADLLAANGLENVSAEDLADLYAALTGVEGAESSLLDTLDGDSKAAILAAKRALDLAEQDADEAAEAQEEAKVKVTDLEENDLLTQIALLKEKIDSGDYSDYNNSYWRAMDALANLTYTYYLTQKVDGYVDGSATFTYVKKDEDGNSLKESEYYTIVTYKITDEDGNETEITTTINYTTDKSKKGSDLNITEKVITENVTDYDNLITPAVEAQDAVYEYQDAEGNALDTSTTKAVVQVDEDTEVVVSNDATAKSTTNCLSDNQRVVEGTTTTTYTVEENEEKTETTTESVQFTDAEDAKEALAEALANKADNQEVVLNVTYNGLFKSWSKDITDVNGFEEWMTGVYNFFGSSKGLSYTLTTTTTTSVVEVVETVTGDVTQTDTSSYTSGTYDTSYEWVKTWGIFGYWKETKSSYDKAKEAAEAAVASYVAQGNGYSATYTLEKDFWGNYYYVITYTHTYTVNGVTISQSTYNGTTYTNTCVSEAVEAQDAVYGTKTTYEDGNNIVNTTDENVASAIAAAKTTYTTTKNVAEDDETVTNAESRAASVKEKLQSVISAITEVLTLKGESETADSQLDTIRSIIETATSNYNSAVAKKAELDAAEENKSSNETETNENEDEVTEEAAATTTVTSAATTTASTSSTPYTTTATSTVLDDIIEIPEVIIPLAGDTDDTTTNTRTVARNNNATDADADADDDADAAADEVVEDVEDEDLEMIEIEDEDTALAGEEKETAKGPAAWMWGLIVALLAAAGFATYKVTKAKKLK